MPGLTALPFAVRLGRRAPAHRFRMLGKRVLVTDAEGRGVVLEQEAYARLAAGRSQAVAPTASAGLLGPLQLDWTGPRRHVVYAARAGRAMTPELARAALDFVFQCPARPLEIEARVEGSVPWATLWFLFEYLERRREWSRREAAASVLSAAPFGSREEDFLARRGVERRCVLRVSGRAPRRAGFGQAALCRVEPGALGPQAWAAALAEAGVRRARFEPASSSAGGLRSFAAFYRCARRALAARGVEDEWETLFSRARPWELPGMDVVGELCIDADGSLYTGQGALALPGDDAQRFCLGRVPERSYRDAMARPAVRACLAAARSERQPQCLLCAYRPFCALPPSENFRLQGSLCGLLAKSPLCAGRMAVLDVLWTERL